MLQFVLLSHAQIDLLHTGGNQLSHHHRQGSLAEASLRMIPSQNGPVNHPKLTCTVLPRTESE